MKMLGLSVIMSAVLLLAGCVSNQANPQRELATSSDQTDSQKRAGLRLQLAIGYYEQRQFEVALDEIKQALHANPNFAEAYSVRALIYMEMGEMSLADENFQHALRFAPNNPDFNNNYGWFLCNNGRAPQSIAYFERTLKNPTYQSPAKALNNAGVCSLKTKDLAGAEKYFNEAFRFEPGNPAANANLAKLNYDRGNYDRARFYVERAAKAEILSADVLWLAIKVEHKLGDRAAEASLVAQLRRRHPASPEYAAFQRGAYDE